MKNCSFCRKWRERIFGPVPKELRDDFYQSTVLGTLPQMARDTVPEDDKEALD